MNVLKLASETYAKSVSLLIIVLFSFVGLMALFFRAKYVPDTAIFTPQNLLYIAPLFLSILILLVWIARQKTKSISSSTFRKIFAASIILQVLIILLLPIVPKNDLYYITHNISGHIVEGNFSDFETNGYLARNPNNILLAFITAGFVYLFGDPVLPLKLVNILLIIGITWCSYRIYKHVFKKDSIWVLLILALFPPILFYVNHVYSDLPTTLLATAGLWLYILRPFKFWWILMPVLFMSAYAFRPVIIIYVVAIVLHALLFRYREQLNSIVLFYLLLFIVFVPLGLTALTKLSLPEDARSLPVWSYIYMGFNQPEIGFQDGSHDLSRGPDDVVQRIQAEGLQNVTTLVLMKEAWIWSEGTYQTENYGIGGQRKHQYSHATLVTHGKAHSVIVRSVNAVSYALNLVLLFCITIAAITIFRTPNGHSRIRREYIVLLLSVIVGFSMFYAVWEIKSRYLFSLYPILIIVGFAGAFQLRETLAKFRRDLQEAIKRP